MGSGRGTDSSKAKVIPIARNRGKTFEEALRLCDMTVELPADRTNAVKLTTMVKELRDSSDCSLYLQGGLLVRLRANGLWKEIEPDATFGEFCEKVFGFGRRTGTFRCTVFERANDVGLTPEKLEEAGWSKARSFLKVADRESLQSWLEKAKGLTVAELDEEVRKAKRTRGGEGGGGGETAQVVKLERCTVLVNVEQKQNIEAAIDLATKVGAPREGVEIARGTALDFLCTDWQANHIDRERGLEWHVRMLERVYGVTITVEGRARIDTPEEPAAAEG